MKLGKRVIAISFLAATVLYMIAGCTNDNAPKLMPEEVMKIATDAYIYGYPLVTFDMARQQETNVSAPDAEHAPMGQMIKMRSYPAVDNHCCAAPNADTLYTMVWLDVSNEPWVLSIPDMGDRPCCRSQCRYENRGAQTSRCSRHQRLFQLPRETYEDQSADNPRRSHHRPDGKNWIGARQGF